MLLILSHEDKNMIFDMNAQGNLGLTNYDIQDWSQLPSKLAWLNLRGNRYVQLDFTGIEIQLWALTVLCESNDDLEVVRYKGWSNLKVQFDHFDNRLGPTPIAVDVFGQEISPEPAFLYLEPI